MSSVCRRQGAQAADTALESTNQDIRVPIIASSHKREIIPCPLGPPCENLNKVAGGFRSLLTPYSEKLQVTTSELFKGVIPNHRVPRKHFSNPLGPPYANQTKATNGQPVISLTTPLNFSPSRVATAP